MAARTPGSAAIAAAIAAEMDKRGLTRAQVTDRIAQRSNRPTGRQWAYRVFTGAVHYTTHAPTDVPNQLLTDLVTAIEPDPAKAQQLLHDIAKLAVERQH